MKTKSLLLFMLMALLAPWAANAQTTVEIGDGTSAGYYTPIGTYYNYSITEQLYTADEIGTAGTITSISFNYAYTAAKDFPITVYMANVDAEDLSTGISLADADEVFDGTLSVTEAGWATIDLDTPFAYDGTSNLLIGVNKGYCQWFSGNTWTYTTAANMARYTQNDNNAYDTSTVPGTLTNNRPNIQIVITAGGGPVCEKPATMEASNVATTSATLTWTGGSGTYNVEYMGGSVTEWTSYLTNTTATSANLSGLTPGTAYQYRVQSVCGSDVSGWKSVSFITMFGIPLVEEFGTSIPTGWAQYTGLLDNVMTDPTALQAATYGWSFGTANNVFDNHARCNIYGTGCYKWLVLPTLAMENNVQLMFDVAYTAYSGTGAPAQTGDDDKFVVLVNNGRTWEIVRQWDNAGSEYVLNDLNTTPITVAIDLSNYAEAGQPITVAFYGESTESNADNNLHIDNVSIDYIPACAKPTGLAVNYEGGNTATVTWEGEASTYNIDVNGNVITGTSPYTLSDLELATTYAVKVQAKCGSDLSEWAGPVSFTTDACMPEDMTIVNYALTDSYGDGWNNNAILVVDESCNIVEMLTIESGSSATGTLRVCGSYVQFLWYKGTYPTETSWVFTDNAGNVLFEGAGSASMATLDVLYTIDNNPYSAPTDVAASEVGPRSAKLSWTETGTATAWQIKLTAGDDEEGTIIDANSNPFVITGLTPETEYFAQVRAIGTNGNSIWTCLGADFTTTEACPAPQNIVVSDVTANSALVSWLGFGESYDLRYVAMPSSKGMRSSINKKPTKIDFNCKTSFGNVRFASSNNKPAMVSGVTGIQHNRDGWYYYDNGEHAEDGGIGTSGGNFYWGIMIPAGSYLETTLTKTSVYDELAMTGTVYIYNDGDTAPAGDALAQADVTLTGAGAFVETEFSEPVTIDPSKNLWIVYYNGSGATYPAATCTAQGDANGRWVSVDGTSWMDVASAVEGCGNFMVRAYLEGAIEVNWIEVTGLTASEYELTGLDPETTYIVQIRSNCGDDGQTDYVGTNFTTISLCDNPYDLDAVEVNATSATLNWTGAQESYILRYRHTEKADPTAPATIILEAHNVWGEDDLSGYQMLIDADATAYGTIIPTSGGLTTSGDASEETYAEFEYKIPVNADGAMTTENIVFDGSVTIQIPAGTYDWCITNPTPGDRIWIASGNGNVNGRQDDFVFEPGVTYEFVVSMHGTNDGVELTTTRPMSDWTEVTVNEVPYTLTGLTAETYYEWQIQGVNASCGELEWSEIQNFTTPEITTLTQTIELAAGTNWFSTYLEITLEDLEAALTPVLSALGNSATATIKNADYNIRYTRGRWGATPAGFVWDPAKMYIIQVSADIEFTLEGMPINPTDHPITIVNGNNWIGFPFNVSMTLTDAFTGFAINGDGIKDKDTNNRYARNKWSNTGLTTMEPGKGYIYISSSSEERILIFPTAK